VEHKCSLTCLCKLVAGPYPVIRIQYTSPRLIYVISNLVLISDLLPFRPGTLLFRVSDKTLYEFLFHDIRATCPTHLILLYLVILITCLKGNKSLSALLLNTLCLVLRLSRCVKIFSTSCSLPFLVYFLLLRRHQVSHPTEQYKVVFISILKSLDSEMENKIL
jgi:hypothetical protein